jgi:hypothetical protein
VGLANPNNPDAAVSNSTHVFISRLPESPRWFIRKERRGDAKKALERIYDKGDATSKLDKLQEAQDNQSGKKVDCKDMLLPGGSQFHPVSNALLMSSRHFLDLGTTCSDSCSYSFAKLVY